MDPGCCCCCSSRDVEGKKNELVDDVSSSVLCFFGTQFCLLFLTSSSFHNIRDIVFVSLCLYHQVVTVECLRIREKFS